MQYIGQFNRATKKLVTVVDLSFFKTDKPSPYPYPYIGYCGTISGNKDGVPILIEAFASIADRFPQHKLVLVGNNSNKAAIKGGYTDLLAMANTNPVIDNKTLITEIIEKNNLKQMSWALL